MSKGKKIIRDSITRLEIEETEKGYLITVYISDYPRIGKVETFELICKDCDCGVEENDTN